MTSATTVSLDFGVPYVTGIVTIEQEAPRGSMTCPMCTPSAVALGEVPAQQEEPSDRAQGWCIAFQDAAAEMWDFR